MLSCCLIWPILILMIISIAAVGANNIFKELHGSQSQRGHLSPCQKCPSVGVWSTLADVGLQLHITQIALPIYIPVFTNRETAMQSDIVQKRPCTMQRRGAGTKVWASWGRRMTFQLLSRSKKTGNSHVIRFFGTIRIFSWCIQFFLLQTIWKLFEQSK